MNKVIRNEKKGFTKALVIFIDILGSQSRNDFQELYEINELFHNELLENVKQDREYIAYQRHIYTFSDCAYLIYDYKDKSVDNWGELFNVALLNCEPLLMKFLSKGLVFRGGVAFGDVYYDENKNMFFGDAVNRAYQYESKTAKFPRIIIEDYVANQIFKIIKKQDICIVRRDSDEQYYLNYFKSLQEGIDYSIIVQKNNTQFIDDLIILCEHRISQFSNNTNVRFKYEWLKEYAEKSINYNIIGKVEYKKPFWDKLFDSSEFKYSECMNANYNVDYHDLFESLNLKKEVMPNVGPSYEDNKVNECKDTRFLNTKIEDIEAL